MHKFLLIILITLEEKSIVSSYKNFDNLQRRVLMLSKYCRVIGYEELFDV